MENRIKEYQLDLYADRTSAHPLRVNQLRLWLASFAYVRICAFAPFRPRLHPAARGHLRLDQPEAVKIGAQARVSAHRTRVALALACPMPNMALWRGDQDETAHCLARIAP